MDRVVEYWDSVADRYLELFRHEFEEKPYDREVLRTFATAVGPRAYVCDAGCGPCGHVTRILADHGLNVVGIDVAPRCIELAKREQPSLKFEVMDLAKMAFAGNALDGIVAYYALHYMPKSALDAVFHEFARALRPDGRVLIVAKNGDGEGWIDDPLGSGLKVFWSTPTAQELEDSLQQNGFTLLGNDQREPLPQEIAIQRIYITAVRAG